VGTSYSTGGEIKQKQAQQRFARAMALARQALSGTEGQGKFEELTEKEGKKCLQRGCRVLLPANQFLKTRLQKNTASNTCIRINEAAPVSLTIQQLRIC
jgi:hypothetical protein